LQVTDLLVYQLLGPAQVFVEDLFLDRLIALPVALLEKEADLGWNICDRLALADPDEDIHEELDADAGQLDRAVVEVVVLRLVSRRRRLLATKGDRALRLRLAPCWCRTWGHHRALRRLVAHAVLVQESLDGQASLAVGARICLPLCGAWAPLVARLLEWLLE
tara:strand:+ start:771 stop:1259 length:489 start_codon:yes stop_codon:yes gene_type:complete